MLLHIKARSKCIWRAVRMLRQHGGILLLDNSNRFVYLVTKFSSNEIELQNKFYDKELKEIST